MQSSSAARAASSLQAGIANTCDTSRRYTKPRLYRENFTPEECQELDRHSPISAISELCVLRILIARVLRALRKLKPTLEHHYKNLVVFSHVGATMASLARFQRKRDGPPHDPFLTELAAMDQDPL